MEPECDQVSVERSCPQFHQSRHLVRTERLLRGTVGSGLICARQREMFVWRTAPRRCAALRINISEVELGAAGRLI
jgi:hypothetical protein